MQPNWRVASKFICFICHTRGKLCCFPWPQCKMLSFVGWWRHVVTDEKSEKEKKQTKFTSIHGHRTATLLSRVTQIYSLTGLLFWFYNCFIRILSKISSTDSLCLNFFRYNLRAWWSHHACDGNGKPCFSHIICMDVYDIPLYRISLVWLQCFITTIKPKSKENVVSFELSLFCM